MSKLMQGLFGELAEAHEAVAVAARKIEGAYGNAAAKSGNSAADGVAGVPAVPAGKKGAAAAPVAAKPAAKAKVTAPTITFDDVKAKLTELMNAKGKEAVKTILSDNGAAKLNDLAEENYADAHAAAVAAMAEEEVETSGDDDDLFGS